MLERFRSKKGDVTSALTDLATLAAEVGATSMAGRINHELIAKLEAERFHLVVVGEFNHGKSTFVNALLGAPILPVGVTPTTAVIHHLEYAETPSAKVVYSSGEEQPIEFSDVRKFMVGSDTPSAESVAHLEVFYPALLLRERIALVDTPGVNDLSLQRSDITYSYIPRSDAVLFLIDAGQPLKESERVFLQDKLLGQSRDKIVFVVTKRDIWSADEQEEALRYIRGELAKLVQNPVVFAVSADQALRGEAEKSGMPELVAHLTRFLAEERGRIMLDNALGEALGAAETLRKGIVARRRSATMSVDELTRRIELLEQDLAGHASTIAERRAAIREEVAAIRAWARRDLDRFVDDVSAQIPAIVDAASGDDLKSHLAAFLEKTLADWVQAETKEIALALESLAERTIALVREDAHDVGSRVSEALGQSVRAPRVEVDTFRYDVGVVALLTLGLGFMFSNALLGGLMFAAAPVLAVYFKDKIQTETRARAKELAPQALRDAALEIGPRIEAMVAEFTERLDAWVVSAGEELHREVIEVLSAARDARERSSRSSADELADCDHRDGSLDTTRDRLSVLCASLWTPDGRTALTEPEPAFAG